MPHAQRRKSAPCKHMTRKTTNREKMCYNKHRHYSLEAAMKAASYDSKRYGKAMTAYQCPVCHYYHITTYRKG